MSYAAVFVIGVVFGLFAPDFLLIAFHYRSDRRHRAVGIDELLADFEEDDDTPRPGRHQNEQP